MLSSARGGGGERAPAKRLFVTKDARERVEPRPTAADYLAQLPDGWASFPACRARASLLRGLRDRGALDALDTLPPPLHPLLEHLRSDGEWIPEVVHVATLLAVRDVRFGASARAEHAFYDWLSQLNRDLFEARPYVGAVAFADPVDLLPRLPAIWESLHEGVPVTMATPSRRRASATVTYPRRLFTPVSLESLRRTLTMLLAKTGAAQVNVGSSSVVTGEETRTRGVLSHGRGPSRLERRTYRGVTASASVALEL